MNLQPRAAPRRTGFVAVFVGLIAAVAVTATPSYADDEVAIDLGAGRVETCLTVLHNNDGESQLVNAGSGIEDFGGVARFATSIRKLRRKATAGPARGFYTRCSKRIALTLNSGDNFLAGPEFNASLQKGVPFFDSIALDRVGYDALVIGNHEFDFGPDVLADFVMGFRQNARRRPFLSANLDFSLEPGLQALADEGGIAKSILLRRGGERIGVIGAITEGLSFISSPRDVIINDVLPAVQTEIMRLQQRGANIIILSSHLQSVQEDLDLLAQLSGIDLAIAGGGDELLANDGDLLIPGDETNVFGPYPLLATDADGNVVPVITTSGSYRYVGRLIVGLNGNRNITQIASLSGPVRVAGGDNPDAVRADPFLQNNVVDPVQVALDALAANVIGSSEVALDGVRANVRTIETNEGNLIADGFHFNATQLAPSFGAPQPDVALVNGGGIRNDDIRGPGDITELDTFDISPFGNFVSVIPDIPREQFREIMENAVSQVENVGGRYAQVSGFSMLWDPSGTPQELDEDGNVVTAGTRVVDITLDDGTAIVTGGAVVPGDALNIATADFLARGGDQYPYRGAPFISLGITDQQGLREYIATGLGGLITAADYPEGGEGRVTRVP